MESAYPQLGYDNFTAGYFLPKQNKIWELNYDPDTLCRALPRFLLYSFLFILSIPTALFPSRFLNCSFSIPALIKCSKLLNTRSLLSFARFSFVNHVFPLLCMDIVSPHRSNCSASPLLPSHYLLLRYYS